MKRTFPILLKLLALSALSPAATAAVDGSFDTTFAGVGYVALAGDPYSNTYSAQVNQIIVESNGNLLLGGPNSHQMWWLGELLPSGNIAPTFGKADDNGYTNGSGRVYGCDLWIDLCSNNFGFRAMALQADGRISVTDGIFINRTTAQAHGSESERTLLAPINNVGGRFYYTNALVQTASGKWLAAGGGIYTGSDNTTDFAVVRLNADFSLDTTFNAAIDGNGVTFAGGQFISFSHGTGDVSAVAVQDDGRIALIGHSINGDLEVARLNADGTLDTTFGGGTGKSTLYWGQGSLDPSSLKASSVKLDRAGRLLVAMPATIPSGVFNFVHQGMAVVRLKPDGSMDSSFGSQGVSFQAFVDSCPNGTYAYALALDSAGRILVAGQCKTSAQSYFFLERLYGDNGGLDTTFGINGTSHGAFAASSTTDVVYDVVFDASGRPLIAGETHPVVTGHPGVARLTYDLIFTNDFEIAPPGRVVR